ncbi:9545_t:CDS:2 [Cetraspora pellucida]|uniref:9545_t:CDS:1 n=1 Tax=Cetraspora pellucida TaxID=1433469 RepID=A0ACA9L1H8_9GLOM|nr:9545_t:CDS:2 [Cetraspora pellucida]
MAWSTSLELRRAEFDLSINIYTYNHDEIMLTKYKFLFKKDIEISEQNKMLGKMNKAKCEHILVPKLLIICPLQIEIVPIKKKYLVTWNSNTSQPEATTTSNILFNFISNKAEDYLSSKDEDQFFSDHQDDFQESDDQEDTSYLSDLQDSDEFGDQYESSISSNYLDLQYFEKPTSQLP